jgi:acyl-CoA synthetase (AMP-forming)/AMP-acid ligase II
MIHAHSLGRAAGANVMRGYWNNSEETKLAFRDGFLRTGDVGYRDAKGYFYILDRLKDMIVTGGENVYSGEVEAVIYQHPAVREAAVFGIPDPRWGELVAACVARKPGTTLSADELIAHCRRSLANYKIPPPRGTVGYRAAEERLRQNIKANTAGALLG